MMSKESKNQQLQEENVVNEAVETTEVTVMKKESVWTKIGTILRKGIGYIIVGGASLGTGILIGTKLGNKTEYYDDSNDVETEVNDSDVQ